jgi:hypothetical protein
MSCDYDIELDVIVDQDYDTNTVLGHFLEVRAKNAIFDGQTGDPYIFLYQREINDPEDGHVVNIDVSAVGDNYTEPTIVLNGGGGQDATATAYCLGTISNVVVESGGTGYTATPIIEIGNGLGFVGTVHLTATGSVKKITVSSQGTGYSATPTVTITGGSPNATAKAHVVAGKVVAIDVLTPGAGYTVATVSITDGTGTGADATAVIGRSIASVSIENPGGSYIKPVLTLTGGGGTGAVLRPVVTGPISEIVVTNPGHHYTTPPTVQILGGGSGAAAVATLDFYGSYFTAVCTPSDLQEVLDTGEPSTPGPTPAKFRLSYVRAYFRSRAEAEYAKTAIMVDVNALLNALRLQCEERHGDPITYKISAR